MARTTRKKPSRRPAESPGIACRQRLTGFVSEQFPFAAERVVTALEGVWESTNLEQLRSAIRERLTRAVAGRPARDALDPTPGVTAGQRWEQA